MSESISFFNLAAQSRTIKEDLSFAFDEIINSSSFISGSYVKLFEDKFSKLHSVKHCISCANGTDALYIALRALGIKPGDEVITTSLSWISTSEAISQAGGIPVFCDIDHDSMLIDLNQLEKSITSKTIGIIPVHLYGYPCDNISIRKFCDLNGLWMLEDCAQAHLACRDGHLVGSLADAATFSFFPTKNLGSFGDAGCIMTNNSDIADFCRLYANHGGKGIHLFEGINSRMDTLQAAVLHAKLKYIREWTMSRISMATNYTQTLTGLGDLKLPCHDDSTLHVFHLYTIRSEYRDRLRDYLSLAGIPTLVNYPKILPDLPCYENKTHLLSSWPVSRQVVDQILQLPLSPYLKESHQLYIIDKIVEFFQSV